jgi:cytoskeleton protein RodZ
MAAEAGGEGRAGIGTRLRAAREKKGLTILQAAEKMHLDARILEALEAEDFAALGAAVYARGHLRHYAELVGEEPPVLLELYANSTRAAPVQPDLTRISHVPPDSESRKLTGSAVVVLVAVAAFGTLWWFMTSPEEKLQPSVVQQTGQVSSAGQSGASAPSVASPAAALAPSPPPTSSARSAPLPPARVHPPAGTGAPSATATAAALSTAAATTAASATSTASAVTAAPPSTHSKAGELTLKFSADSWAEVYDASGQRLFYDVGAASTAHTVRGSVPMRVVLGNAAGVSLEFNGRPAPMPSGVRADGSLRFIINAHGRAVPATDGG